MRISDWSSDVCSSDLRIASELPLTLLYPHFFFAANSPGKPRLAPLRLRIGRGLHQALQRMLARVGKLAHHFNPSCGDIAWINATNTPSFVMNLKHDERCFRSEDHTSELPSLMRNSYSVFCLKKK